MTSNQSYFNSPQQYRIQKTILGEITFEGIGLHTGEHSVLTLKPSLPNKGIFFTKKVGAQSYHVPAQIDSVVSTTLCTTLGLAGEPASQIKTVEHLLAAVYALGITNLEAEITGPEVPILDGSSLCFVDQIWNTGIEIQPFTSPILKVLKPIKIYEKGGICELLPRERLRLTTSIDFNHPQIGLQTFAVELTPEFFSSSICGARTFGFEKDLSQLRASNLALGASVENVVAFSETGILNTEGMRFEDECVRHKLLDTIGDFSLCGGWLEGEIVSHRGGHSIHLASLKALQAHPENWKFIEPEPLPSMKALHIRKSSTMVAWAN